MRRALLVIMVAAIAGSGLVLGASPAAASTGVGVTVAMDCPAIDGVTIYRPEVSAECGPQTANGVTIKANRFTTAFAPQVSSRVHTVVFVPGTRPAPYVCVRWEAVAPARSPSQATGCVTAPSASSGTTLDLRLPAVWGTGYLANSCNGTTTGTDWSAMWCVGAPAPFREVNPLYWWFDTDPTGVNMGAPPAPPQAIPLPMAGCARTLKQQADGRVTASMAVTVLNPDPDSTDTLWTRTQWDAEWVQGGRRTVSLPHGDGQIMPSGGWDAWCRVTRTVNAAAVGNPRTAIDTETAATYATCPAGEYWLEATQACAAPSGGFTVPGGIPILAPLPAIMPKVAPPTVMPPPSTVPYVAPSFGTIAGVGGAGILGYLAGGALSTLLDEPLGQDQEWLCRWNPGYRALNGGLCENLGNIPKPQTAIQVATSTGTPASLTDWAVAHAYASLKLDPSRPTRVTTLTPVPNDPRPLPTPEQATAIEVAATDPSPPAGNDDDVCPTGLGLLNPLAFGKILRCLFIPTRNPLATMWGTVSGKFPFTVVANVGGFAAAVVGIAGTGNATGCPSVDFGSVIPGDVLDETKMVVHAPTPTGSGCPNAGGFAGDMGGYRAPFRLILAGFMWAFVMLRLASSVGPEREHGLVNVQ